VSVRSLLVAALLCATAGGAMRAQAPPPPGRPVTTPPVERLGKDLVRVGNVRVNTALRELSVPGTVNGVKTLEFLANTPNGLKAYESALTLNTDGVTFNTALLMLGLDNTRTRMLPSRELDGDRVELWVEANAASPGRFRAERLVFDQATGKEMPEGTWVYTGSLFADNGRYLADMDGVLIGFVHTRSAIIDHPEAVGIGRYGSVILNPNLGLAANAPVTLVVKAVSAPK